MGIALQYASCDAVPPDVRAAIRENANAANADRAWLVMEPIEFFEKVPGYEDKLIGWSKIAPQHKEIRESPDDDRDDAHFIVSELERWSKTYTIDWEFRLEGSVIGYIRGGAADSQLSAAIEGLSVFGEIDMDDLLEGLM